MSGRRYDVAFYLPTLGPLIDRSAAVPFAGGAEKQVWLLARALADRGYSVCVVVTDVPGGLPRRAEGVDVVVRPPWQGGRCVSGWLTELRSLWRAIGPLEAEVVVQRAAGFSTGLVAGITRLQRRRFVYSSANLVDFEYERLASSRKDLRLFELGVRLADVIVVQSSEQARRCRSRFGRDATVIRSIAEPAERAVSPPGTFLWIGRLVSYKHPEAFVALARALPEARFQLVGLGSGGEASLQRTVEQSARQLSNLELLPVRSQSELLPLYDRAVAVVNTAEWEGMPNTFLEAWARGVPALALTHDPDGLIDRKGLGAFAGGSPERLAALARELWASRNSREEMAERCREHVRREHAAELVIDHWIQALGLRSGPDPGLVWQRTQASTYARP